MRPTKIPRIRFLLSLAMVQVGRRQALKAQLVP